MPQSAEQMGKTMDALWGNQPPWFASACVIWGACALILNGLYLFAGIALFQMKRYAVKFFLWVLGMSIVMTIIRVAILYLGMSFMGLGFAFMGFIGIILDIVLIMVIISNDRTVFNAPPPETR